MLILSYTLPQYILFFFLYGILGWCTEVAYAAAETHTLVNRGFLNGPICPIYGFGMLALIACLEPLKHNFLLLFLGGTVLATVIELVGGAIMFQIFHTRWWDYSMYKWNYKGYICPLFSVLWGIGSVIMMRMIHPAVAYTVVHLPVIPLLLLDGVLLVGIGVDLGISGAEAAGLNKRLRELDSLRAGMRITSDKMTEIIGTNAMTIDVLLDHQKLQLVLAAMEGRDNAAELQKQLRSLAARAAKVRDEGVKMSHQRFFGTGRLLRAFPDMKSAHHAEALANMREHISEAATDLARITKRTAKAAANTAKAAVSAAKTTAQSTAETLKDKLEK